MIHVKEIQHQSELNEAHAIRREVFVIEQSCPEDIEWEYEDESHHFLATVDGKPAGTARWRETANGIKLERFAVLQEYRNSGVGAAILKKVLQSVPRDGREIYLHAQLTAKNFYLKHGFVPVGDEFMEADIPHVKMMLS
jgi:predicted GNAT family N-acyltransferase